MTCDLPGALRIVLLFVAVAVTFSGVTGCDGRRTSRADVAGTCESVLDCRFGLACQESTGTCQNADHADDEGAGVGCETNNDCGGDLRCQPETMTCQFIDGGGIPGPALLGEGCGTDDDCDEGLVCQFASVTCQPPVDETINGLGASCITNGDCAGDLICQDASNTCQPAPDEG
jgi:hypothetical protein